MTTNHTPTPWRMQTPSAREAQEVIVGADGTRIANVMPIRRESAKTRENINAMYYEARGNAEQIVARVNAHDALTARVAELEAALRGLIYAHDAIPQGGITRLADNRLSAAWEVARTVAKKDRA